MAAEKQVGKPIKDELLAAIKAQVNKIAFPYLDFIDESGKLNHELVKTLQIEIPCNYAAHITKKLCTLIVGHDIVRFIPTGDNFRGILTGFNVYGKIMAAYGQNKFILVYFEWKGVYHE